MNNRFPWGWAVLITLVVVAIGLAVRFTAFGYILHDVEQGEIAIKLRENKVIGVVGPGIYRDTDFFADIQNVDVRVLRWCAFDSEVLTKGENTTVGQRVGVVVCGTVQRPTLADSAVYTRDNAQAWSNFYTYYTDNEALVGVFTEIKDPTSGDIIVSVETAGLMQNLAQQAMKACVGDATFGDAVVGSARDALAICIQDEVAGRAGNFGSLKVDNVTVPNVILTPEARALVDAITTSQLQTAQLAQERERVEEQGKKDLAERVAAIQVAQGELQEKERQRAITAGLTVEALKAERAVIEATANNQLLEARRALEVNEALYQANVLKAKADRADDAYFASILTQNPSYAMYLTAEIWSQAIKDTDKIIPIGSNPYTIINPWPGQVPGVTLPPQ